MKYRWWHRWWDRMRGRKNIEMKRDGQKALCLVCLESLDAEMSNVDSFRTFTLGTDEGNCFVFGVLPLCEEHKELKDPTGVLLYRAAVLYQLLYGAKKC